MIVDPAEIRAILERGFSAADHKHVLAFTRRWLRLNEFFGIPWQGGLMLPKGLDEQDLVNRAIEKALNGTRKWDRDKCPIFKHFLMWAIKSEISHLAESIENQKTDKIDPLAKSAYSDKTFATEDSPEILSLRKWDNELKAQFVSALFSELSNDSDLTGLAECLMDGMPPREITKKLNINEAQVLNMKKRLMRKAEKLLRRPEFQRQAQVLRGGKS